MTDFGGVFTSVPARLGVTARVEGEELILDLTTCPEVLCHGIVRASVLSFLVDAVAGVTVDDDPDCWTLTTDLSLRTLPVTDPGVITAHNTVLRRGRRSAVCRVELGDPSGARVATSAIGFTMVPRRPTDGPKPRVTLDRALRIFDAPPSLTRPLRDEAGIEVVDAGRGEVEVLVTSELRNPAGTLQGAMVALVAEAAAEELLASRFGRPVVVTDLDVRYLAQVADGPVRTRCEIWGDAPDAPVEIELVDVSSSRVTTHAFARATPVG